MTATPDETTEGWWRIAQHSGESSYGYGTQDEAERLATLWSDDRRLDVDRYQVEEADETTAAALDAGRRDDGFVIDEELADVVECAICAGYGAETYLRSQDATEIDHDPARDGLQERRVYACAWCVEQGALREEVRP